MLETNLCSDSQTTVAELVEGGGSRGGLELHDKNVRPRCLQSGRVQSAKGTNLGQKGATCSAGISRSDQQIGTSRPLDLEL